ncbi:MAG: VCBS repeat-containing protein, partial [Acidimicrobiales bacterium]|nr:VCBS repeat-containing protein [Acidimicrobiales bacterium]
DLEGDGDLDFVVDGAANEGFVVLRADGGGYSSSAPAPIAGSGPGSHLRRLLGVGDLDQDGRVELAFLERPSSSWATDYGKVVFLAGAADLAPVAALEMPFGPSSGYSLVTWMPRRVLDLDGDGLLDLLGDGGMILGDGRGRPPVQTLSRRGSLHDLDHDGDLDLVNPDLVRHNDGSGSFESLADGLPRLPVGTPPGLLAIHYLLDDGHAEADFDGDGYLDLLLTAELTPMSGPTRRESRLLLGLPDGRLQDAGPAAAGQRIVGEPNRPILVRDLDADGDLDLAVPDQLWLNDGGNQFSADLVTLLGYDPIDAAQIDGDPGLELLARPNVFGMVGLVLFDPGLTGPPAVFPVSASLTGGERFADLDDDADLDLIFLDYYASQIRIYENVGNLLLPSWNSAPGIINFSPTVVGDFDGDGQTDFISGDRLFRNMGPGNTTGFQEVARMGYVVEAAGDLDGDGDLDFLGGVTQSNRLRVPTAAGAGLQYGTGTPGSGGFRPLLGFDGPLDPASPTAAVRLANGLGAGSGMLYVGLVSNDQPDYGAPGLTSYVDPGTIVNLFSVQLGGVLNAAGEGEIRLPFAVLPAWIGLRVYLQAAFYDPAAPYFHTVTNGLELLFGS